MYLYDMFMDLIMNRWSLTLILNDQYLRNIGRSVNSVCVFISDLQFVSRVYINDRHKFSSHLPLSNCSMWSGRGFHGVLSFSESMYGPISVWIQFRPIMIRIYTCFCSLRIIKIVKLLLNSLITITSALITSSYQSVNNYRLRVFRSN